MSTTATKFWAALIIVTGNVVRNRYGVDMGIDDQIANDIAGYLVAGAVWLFPNRKKA